MIVDFSLCLQVLQMSYKLFCPQTSLDDMLYELVHFKYAPTLKINRLETDYTNVNQECFIIPQNTV